MVVRNIELFGDNVKGIGGDKINDNIKNQIRRVSGFISNLSPIFSRYLVG